MFVNALPQNPFQRRLEMMSRYGRTFIGARERPNKPYYDTFDTRLHQIEPITGQRKSGLHPFLPTEPLVQEAAAEANYLHAQDFMDPINVLISGRKGTFKSVVTGWLETWFCRAFGATTIDGERQQRVLSNYYVKEVQEAGPIAEEQKYEFDPQTGEFRPQYSGGEPMMTSVNPCDIEHPAKIAKLRPIWGYDTLIGIDELSSHVSTMRATGREVRMFNQFLSQQRKSSQEIISNTQFIHLIPPSSIACYFDLFVRLKAYPDYFDKDGNRGLVLIKWYDFFSNQLDREWKYRDGKLNWFAPPDWIRAVKGVLNFAPQINTRQIIPPTSATPAERAAILAAQERYFEWITPSGMPQHPTEDDMADARTMREAEDIRDDDYINEMVRRENSR